MSCKEVPGGLAQAGVKLKAPEVPGGLVQASERFKKGSGEAQGF